MFLPVSWVRRCVYVTVCALFVFLDGVFIGVVVCVFTLLFPLLVCVCTVDLRLRRRKRVSQRASRLFTCWRVGRFRGYGAGRSSTTSSRRHDVFVDGYGPDVDGYGPRVLVGGYGPDVHGYGLMFSLTATCLMFNATGLMCALTATGLMFDINR